MAAPPEARLKPVILAGAVALALIAGWTDLRSRRIPNWLTVPGLVIDGLEHASRGLEWLEDFSAGRAHRPCLAAAVRLLRSLGAGDWKLAGALGSFTGPALLTDLLIASVFVAGPWR
jgi:prepilin peptidase CpaA